MVVNSQLEVRMISMLNCLSLFCVLGIGVVRAENVVGPEVGDVVEPLQPQVRGEEQAEGQLQQQVVGGGEQQPAEGEDDQHA